MKKIQHIVFLNLPIEGSAQEEINLKKKEKNRILKKEKRGSFPHLQPYESGTAS